MYLMFRVDVILKWQIHCSGPYFIRNIYTVSVLCVHGVVHVCACREAVGLPEFTVKFQNGICKAVAACAPDPSLC